MTTFNKVAGGVQGRIITEKEAGNILSCLSNFRPLEQKQDRHAQHHLSRLSRHSRTVGWQCQNADDFVIKVLT